MLQYKGVYNAGTTYDVGDIVVFTDNVPYHMTKAAPEGTACHDVRYWSRVQPPLGDAIIAFNYAIQGLDGIIAEQGEALTAVEDVIIDEKTLVLASSTEDSTKKFAITVDDDGDLTATEITEEEDEGEGE